MNLGEEFRLNNGPLHVGSLDEFWKKPKTKSGVAGSPI